MVKQEMLKKTAAKATELYVTGGLEKKVTQKEAEIILTAYSEMIREELTNNREEKVPMINIGDFNVKHTKAKDGEMNGVAWHKDAEDHIALNIHKSKKVLG